MVEVQPSTAQRNRIRRDAAPRTPDSEVDGGELNIVPFLDIVVNILIFVLATVAVTFTSTVSPQVSERGVRRETTSLEPLNLTVLVVDGGFAIKAFGANISASCASTGTGLAVPNAAARRDFTALQACAHKLRRSHPSAATSQVRLGANPGTDYQTIVSTMDALRTDPRGEVMFPDVSFVMPRGR